MQYSIDLYIIKVSIYKKDVAIRSLVTALYYKYYITSNFSIVIPIHIKVVSFLFTIITLVYILLFAIFSLLFHVWGHNIDSERHCLFLIYFILTYLFFLSLFFTCPNFVWSSKVIFNKKPKPNKKGIYKISNYEKKSSKKSV